MADLMRHNVLVATAVAAMRNGGAQSPQVSSRVALRPHGRPHCVKVSTRCCLVLPTLITQGTRVRKGVNPMARNARCSFRIFHAEQHFTFIATLVQKMPSLLGARRQWTQHAREPRFAQRFDPADSQGRRHIDQQRSGEAQAIQTPRDTGGASKRGTDPVRIQLLEGRH